MPWKKVTTMSLRLEFVKFALVDGSNISELCRRFDISRKTGYKWINRFLNKGYSGLSDHSRRPKTTPNRTDKVLEDVVVEVRKRHPAWGACRWVLATEAQGRQIDMCRPSVAPSSPAKTSYVAHWRSTETPAMAGMGSTTVQVPPTGIRPVAAR